MRIEKKKGKTKACNHATERETVPAVGKLGCQYSCFGQLFLKFEQKIIINVCGNFQNYQCRICKIRYIQHNFQQYFCVFTHFSSRLWVVLFKLTHGEHCCLYKYAMCQSINQLCASCAHFKPRGIFPKFFPRLRDSSCTLPTTLGKMLIHSWGGPPVLS